MVGSAGAKRLAVIHNGVDPAVSVSPEERAAARVELNIPEDAVAGAWLGGLDPVKDPVTAARGAMSVFRDDARIVLLVAGDGPLRTELERLARESGGDSLRLLGFRADVRPVLAAADFYVNSSEREGLSFALLEASRFGLLPVVSNVFRATWTRLAIRQSVVQAGDIQGFASAFRGLLDDGPETALLGGRARDRVTHSFSAEGMVQQTRAVYEDILSSK